MSSSTKVALPEVHAFWVGERLGPLASACLSSFVRMGHPTRLHCYRPPTGVPRGVVLEDAEKTIPERHFFRHKHTQSAAIFADLFRYELLHNGAEIYVDCDVYCLKPIPREEFVFGLEAEGRICNAILSMPPKSELLKHMLELRWTGHRIWPWEPKGFRYALDQRIALLTGQTPLAVKHWGSTGPDALSYWARRLDVLKLAKDIPVFYPLPYDRVDRLFESGLTVRDLVSNETLCLHLFNEAIRALGRKAEDAPVDSPMGEILGGIDLG